MIFLEIENKTGKVKLNEQVSRESIGRMIDEIGKLFGATASASGADYGEIMNAAENAVDVLEIEINSPGGSVFDGYTIYQEIQSLKDRGVVVNATITGMAASMASVICMACNKVSIVPHGRMMIHDASSGFSGNAEQMRKQADLLDGISADIANIYSARTGKEVAEIRAMMRNETWMNAEATVENGFADEIAKFDKEPKSKMSILAKLFPNNDQVEQIEAAIQENDSIRAELVSSQERIAELESSIQDHALASSNLIEAQTKITEFEALVEVKDIEIANLKAEIQSVDDKAAIKAAELLAQNGHPQAVNLNDDSEETDHIKILSNLKGSERTAYYNANQTEIKKQLKK
jgi:ATP-dependent Clp endopeptidase proteolytic subunit ClpP